MVAAPTKPPARSTAAEKILRVEKVVDLLIVGNSRPEIIRFGEKEWGVGRHAVDRYIQDANRKLAKAADVHRATELAKAIRRCEHLYRKAYEAGDLNTARLVQKDLSDLLDLKVSTESAKIGDIPTVRLVIDNGEVKLDG